MEAAELRYDVILASEAVYKAKCFSISCATSHSRYCPEQLLQVDFYPDLLALLEHLAADGRALFAGKRFYFGCGGGTASQLQSDGHH